MKQEIPPKNNNEKQKKINEEFIVGMKSFLNNPERHSLNQEQVDDMVENFMSIFYFNRTHPEESFDKKKFDVNWWSIYHADLDEHAIESYELFKNLLKTNDYEYDFKNISFAEKCLKSCIEKGEKFPYESVVFIDRIINSSDFDLDYKNSNEELEDSDDEELDIREALIIDCALNARKRKLPREIYWMLLDKTTEFIYGDDNHLSDEHKDYYDSYYDDQNGRKDIKNGELGHDSLLKIRELLNFEDKDRFSDASETLSLLDDISRTRRKGTSTRHVSNNDAVVHMLEDVVFQNKGSYLLNLRARNLQKSILEDGFEISEQEGLPFLVKNDVYAVRFESGVFLSDPRNFLDISKLMKRYIMIANGDHIDKEDNFEILKKVWEYFDKKISNDDVATYAILDKSSEQNNHQMKDFSYLMEDKMKEIIEAELGFSLLDLDLREQFYFLNFVKEKTVSDIGEVKKFVKEYGLTGLKVFLSCGSKNISGDDILNISKNLESNPDVVKKIFETYLKIIEEEKNIFKNRIIFLINNKKELSGDELNNIIDRLFRDANLFLLEQIKNSSSKEKVSADDLSKQIEKINSKVILLEKIISQLSRDEVANLDLREIADIEKIEDLPSSELVEDKELLGKISEVVSVNFPSGDKEVFIEECKNEKLEFTITLANGEILSAYSRKKLESGVIYLDWFVSNKNAPLKGMGEATSKLEFYNKGTENEQYYAVAKPHVKSFQILIEKMGFVSFAGSTEDGEYKHHYSRCRLTADDKKLLTKNLSDIDEQKLKKILVDKVRNDNNPEIIIFNGEKLKVTKVNYGELNHRDDVKKEDKEGWLYREIEKNSQDSYILSRYISVDDKKENNAYYAVFEKSLKSKEEEEGFFNKVVLDKSGQDEDDDQEERKRAVNK